MCSDGKGKLFYNVTVLRLLLPEYTIKPILNKHFKRNCMQLKHHNIYLCPVLGLHYLFHQIHHQRSHAHPPHNHCHLVSRIYNDKKFSRWAHDSFGIEFIWNVVTQQYSLQYLKHGQKHTNLNFTRHYVSAIYLFSQVTDWGVVVGILWLPISETTSQKRCDISYQNVYIKYNLHINMNCYVLFEGFFKKMDNWLPGYNTRKALRVDLLKGQKPKKGTLQINTWSKLHTPPCWRLKVLWYISCSWIFW